MKDGLLAVGTLLAALGMPLAIPGALAAEPMARVLSVSGVATAQAGAATRILGANDALSQKDVISVGPDSHALIEFSDRTRLTLRPNTLFKVDAYSTQAPESALFGLLRGGFRAVTGFISKLNPDAFKVATPTATMGIRGTEFDARLCEQDCAEEESRFATAGLSRRVVARVVESNGAATAGKAGALRGLVPGAMVYAGEDIATAPGAYAVLAFRDGTRIILADGARLAVALFEFDEAAPEKGRAHLSLVSGTAHVWTGRLAKINPDAFHFETALGPIRLHGTGFSVSGAKKTTKSAIAAISVGNSSKPVGTNTDSDTEALAARISAEANAAADRAKNKADSLARAAAFQNNEDLNRRSHTARREAEEAAEAAKQAEAEAIALTTKGMDRPKDMAGALAQGTGHAASPNASEGAGSGSSGIEVSVWDGAVEVGAGDERKMVRKGETGMLTDAGGKRTLTVAAAGTAATGTAPRPDKVKTDASLFGDEAPKSEPGLYVWVREGAVALTRDGETLNVGAGEAAVVTKDKAARLEAVPNFMRFDRTPTPQGAAPQTNAALPAFRAPDAAVSAGCAVK